MGKSSTRRSCVRAVCRAWARFGSSRATARRAARRNSVVFCGRRWVGTRPPPRGRCPGKGVGDLGEGLDPAQVDLAAFQRGQCLRQPGRDGHGQVQPDEGGVAGDFQRDRERGGCVHRTPVAGHPGTAVSGRSPESAQSGALSTEFPSRTFGRTSAAAPDPAPPRPPPPRSPTTTGQRHRRNPRPPHSPNPGGSPELERDTDPHQTPTTEQAELEPDAGTRPGRPPHPRRRLVTQPRNRTNPPTPDQPRPLHGIRPDGLDEPGQLHWRRTLRSTGGAPSGRGGCRRPMRPPAARTRDERHDVPASAHPSWTAA